MAKWNANESDDSEGEGKEEEKILSSPKSPKEISSELKEEEGRKFALWDEMFFKLRIMIPILFVCQVYVNNCNF